LWQFVIWEIVDIRVLASGFAEKGLESSGKPRFSALSARAALHALGARAGAIFAAAPPTRAPLRRISLFS
jgi:hypothetical protein